MPVLNAGTDMRSSLEAMISPVGDQTCGFVLTGTGTLNLSSGLFATGIGTELGGGKGAGALVLKHEKGLAVLFGTRGLGITSSILFITCVTCISS